MAPGSPRREQRRRLLISWNRGPAVAAGAGGDAPAPAEYAPAALPERQPAVAALLPVRLARFAASAAGIVLVTAAVTAVGFHQPVLGAAGRAVGPKFAGSVAALRACLDPRLAQSLAGWLGHVFLLAGAAVALAVRSMRRHRRDDFSGRYRAWGWMACVLCGTSCAAHVPVGRFVGTLISEATGITLGPAGLGWWVAITATLLGGVSLWTVLPLHERLATGLWLGAGLAAWTVSTAAAWLGASRPVDPGIAPAAWAAGGAFVAIAMLAAARSVIREVRGEAGAAAKQTAAKPAPAPAARVTVAPQADRTAGESREQPAWMSGATATADYTDGSDVDEDRETRHLSKAERKRLRKLARMNRAA